MAVPPDDADDLGSLFDDEDDEEDGFDGTLLDNTIFSGPEIPAYPTLATFGNYQILGRIARGGMAEVYLAREPQFGSKPRHLVLKKVIEERADDADFLEMFHEEGRIAVRLYHPNVCHVYECGQIEGTSFLAMEWVYGVPLRKLIRRSFDHGGVPIPIAVKIIAQSADALEYVHHAKGVNGKALDIVHRDVSPHNIMVSWKGEVKLLDFGIAKTTALGKEESGQLRGKFSYMSPEQAKGEEVDPRSDIFSLGIVLYELLTGKPLYRRDSMPATLGAIIHEPPPPASAENPEVPPELDSILRRTLEKDKHVRYQSAGELSRDLESFLRRSKELVAPRRIAMFLDKAFDEADKRPLNAKSAKLTGTFTALTSSQISEVISSSGSFGPFGKGPRVSDPEERRPPPATQSQRLPAAPVQISPSLEEEIPVDLDLDIDEAHGASLPTPLAPRPLAPRPIGAPPTGISGTKSTPVSGHARPDVRAAPPGPGPAGAGLPARAPSAPVTVKKEDLDAELARMEQARSSRRIWLLSMAIALLLAAAGALVGWALA